MHACFSVKETSPRLEPLFTMPLSYPSTLGVHDGSALFPGSSMACRYNVWRCIQRLLRLSSMQKDGVQEFITTTDCICLKRFIVTRKAKVRA